MASILNVDQINNAAGTSGIALDASTGKASFPNSVTIPNGATMPAGSVLQVQQNTYATWTTTTSTSWGATGLDCTITPKLITSELLINITIAGGYLSSTSEIMYLALYRGGALVTRLDDTFGHVYGGNGISGAWSFRHTAPQTTATTYQLFWTTNNVGTIGINNYAGRIGANGNTKSTMTITEIAQ